MIAAVVLLSVVAIGEDTPDPKPVAPIAEQAESMWFGQPRPVTPTPTVKELLPVAPVIGPFVVPRSEPYRPRFSRRLDCQT